MKRTVRARRHIAPRSGEQYLLRMPVGMRKRLEERADRTGHSVNTEIVMAIEEHLDKPTVLQRIERLEERVFNGRA